MIKNAADENKVKTEDQMLAREREQELNDLRIILGTGEGRRFLWRLMSHCKVFGSVWSPSASIHYLAGKQDVGHYIWGEVAAANEDAVFLMMQEARNLKETREAILGSITPQGANDV